MTGFSDSVRQELLGVVPDKACCLQSELNALTQRYGTILLRGGGRYQIRYRLPDNDTARMVFRLLKRRLAMTPQIAFHVEPYFRKRRLIDLLIGELDAKRLLVTLHMIDPRTGSVMLHHIPRGTRTRRCCRNAFLRGLFIGCGHVRDPERVYLTEFTLEDMDRAQIARQLLEEAGLHPSDRRRGEKCVIYLDQADETADLLALMGARGARFAWADIRIRREASGVANRQTNCDAANTGRMLAASDRQLELCRSLARRGMLPLLPRRLGEIARLRIDHPSAAMTELGELCDPPIGKAAVHRRFSQLAAYADQTEKDEQKTKLDG